MKEAENNTVLCPVLGNAVAVIFVGLIFVFFSFSFMGIDLLIDAVGWILVFNGVRVYERPRGGIGFIAVLCLILCVASALLLFFSGTAFLLVHIVYAIMIFCFFMSLSALFFRSLMRFHFKKSAFICLFSFGITSVLFPLLSLAPLLPAALSAPISVSLLVKLLPLGTLLWLCFFLRKCDPNG